MASQGDATNAVLAAAGYNFRRTLRWLKLLLSQIVAQIIVRVQFVPELKPRFFIDDDVEKARILTRGA